jgi:DNA-binding protein H-NS
LKARIMMRHNELQKMSYKELLKLQERIARAIEKKRVAERAALKKKPNSMAKKAGSGKAREGAPSPSIKVKYRHPTNHSLVWTGRGRRPKWLVAEGGDVERFRVA